MLTHWVISRAKDNYGRKFSYNKIPDIWPKAKECTSWIAPDSALTPLRRPRKLLEKHLKVLRKGLPRARFPVCVKEHWLELQKASALVLPIPLYDLISLFLGLRLPTCKGRIGLSLRVSILVLLLSRLQCT